MRTETDDAPALAVALNERDRRCGAIAAELAREAKLSEPSEPQVIAAAFIDDSLAALAPADFPYYALLALLPDRESARHLEHLLRRYSPAVAKVPARLSSCPAVIFKALALLRREPVTLQEVEKLVSCDAVLASSLLSFANSALFSRTSPVISIAAAIAYVGIPAAKRVILSASTRPLYSSAELCELWRHSVDTASIAERLAVITKTMDPGEAFVAGLIHDIGRIAIESTNHDDFVLVHRRVTHATGCAELADIMLTGQDHGQIGAALLASWNMPRDLIDGVRFHQRPERSEGALASILYLAETIAGPEEVVPSQERLEYAMHTAKVDSFDSIKSDLRRLGTALAMVG